MRTGLSQAKLVQGQKLLKAGGLLSSSQLNVRGILSHGYRRICPLEIPTFSLKVEQGVEEEWDYSTDLPVMTVEQFRNYEGFKNKSSPSMIHDELGTIMIPNQFVAEFKYLGTGSYIKMSPDYWSELFNTKARASQLDLQSINSNRDTLILMLGPSLRGLFLAQSILGIPIQEITKSPSYVDLTPIARLTLDDLKLMLGRGGGGTNSTLTRPEALSQLVRQSLGPPDDDKLSSLQKAYNFIPDSESIEQGTTQRCVIVISSYEYEQLSRVLIEELTTSRRLLVSRYLVGPMTLVQAARSTSAISIQEALDAGVTFADLRMLSLHSQQVLLPISLSLDDFRSEGIQEIKQYKQGLSRKFRQLLVQSGREDSNRLDKDPKEDWKLIRDYSKCLEAILQTHKQADIAEMISQTTSKAAISSRQTSKPLEQFYRQLESHLTKALESTETGLSQAVVEESERLVDEVF